MTDGADLPFELVGGETRLRVRVTPRAAHNHVGGIHRGSDGRVSLLVRITTPPERGKANKAVIDTLAGALGLARSCLTVKTGRTDRTKVIAIAGDPAAIQSALQGLIVNQQKE